MFTIDEISAMSEEELEHHILNYRLAQGYTEVEFNLVCIDYNKVPEDIFQICSRLQILRNNNLKCLFDDSEKCDIY